MRSQSDGCEAQQYRLGANVHLARLYIARKEQEKARRVRQRLLIIWKKVERDLPLKRDTRRISASVSTGRAT